MASVPELKRQGRAFAEQYGVDPDIFERQIQEESGWNPNVPNSRAGAQGIAQFMPATAAQFGVNPRDPISSLRGAAQADGQYLKKYGSYPRMLAAYNWGTGSVEQWNGSRWTLPIETRQYLDDILGSGWPQGNLGGPTTIPGGGAVSDAIGSIGGTIAHGFSSGIEGWFTNLFAMQKDAFISHYANQICLASGIGLILVGGIGLASHTTVGGAAIDAAAATGNPIAIGAAGIKAASGGTGGGSKRIVARPVNVSLRRKP